MNFIINYVYLLAFVGICLIAIWLFINGTRDKPTLQPKFNQPKPKQQEPEVEEDDLTIVFTFTDGTTKKYTDIDVYTSDTYFEISKGNKIITRYGII